MAVGRVARALRGCEAGIVSGRGVLPLYTVRADVHDCVARLMRRDLLISLLALVAGAGAALLVLGSNRERAPVAVSAAVALLVGWTYIASGLIARRQRPENRLGTVMVFIGFAWFATFLADAGSSLVFTLGKALESVYLLGFVYLVLSFPTGRLRSRLERMLIVAAVTLVTVVEVAWLLFANSRSQICSECPSNAFEITRNDRIADGILQGQRTVGVVLSLFTVALRFAAGDARVLPSGEQGRRCCGPEARCSQRSGSRSQTTSSIIGNRVRVDSGCRAGCALAYVRRETLAGTPNAKLVRDLRAQAKRAVATLEHGLGNYGVKRN
jgi:hypothetical protein